MPDMAIRVRTPAGFRPWVDQVANYIQDPVSRLRFLKAVAPVAPSGRRRQRVRMKWWLISAAVVFVSLSILYLRGAPLVHAPSAAHHPVQPPVQLPPAHTGSTDVWLVERRGESETYSNGLRIDSHFATATHARSYLAFPMQSSGPPERRSKPAGIVFHTTESQQAPFEARQNGKLKRIGESLLDYVRRLRCYNFVIDRFGRVYRVVPEDEAANHAGHSLWADDQWAYLNLNESFLGVSFEAETRHPQMSAGQERSAIMLVEMLRGRFRIAPANCVTHAQVSVNPSNMRVGYHMDWSSGFPFASLGLPDNYLQPLPSVGHFGFESDEGFRAAAGESLRIGITQGEGLFAAHTKASKLGTAAYRKLLRANYRDLMEEVRKFRKEEAEDPES